MFAESIDNEVVRELPKIKFTGQTIVVNQHNIQESIIDEFRAAGVIGFDTETKPSFKRGVSHGTALLQLSTQNTALLVKLKEVGIPDQIMQLLQEKKLVKVGAAIRDDIIGLKQVRKFNPGGFVDLQSIAPEFGINEKSVRKLAAIVLGAKISKTQQLSNWEALQYTEAQVDYASTDAWVCREIFLKFQSIDSKKVCP